MDTLHPYIVISAGGHAKVIIDALRASGKKILGIVDRNSDLHGKKFCNLPILGDDDEILNHKRNSIFLANGLGAVATNNNTGLTPRTRIYTNWKEKGYIFPPIVHPNAYVSSTVIVGQGAQVMAGAIIQPDVILEENIIINTGTSVDHDSIIRAHAHIAPGCTLCGTVIVGTGSYVGTGSVVFQNVQVGAQSVISGGSTVRKNVPDGCTLIVDRIIKPS